MPRSDIAYEARKRNCTTSLGNIPQEKSAKSTGKGDPNPLAHIMSWPNMPMSTPGIIRLGDTANWQSWLRASHRPKPRRLLQAWPQKVGPSRLPLSTRWARLDERARWREMDLGRQSGSLSEPLDVVPEHGSDLRISLRFIEPLEAASDAVP